MAKQTLVLAFIFFAAVGMTAAQEPQAPAAAPEANLTAAREANLTAAAHSLAPAAAKAGLNISNATDFLGALKTAAANAPGAEGVLKGTPPPAEPKKDGAAAIKTGAAVGALTAVGVVGSLLF